MSRWISVQWSFLVASLSLHGLLGLFLVNFTLATKTHLQQEILIVKIVEEKQIQREEKKNSLPEPAKNFNPPEKKQAKKEFAPPSTLEERNIYFPPMEEREPEPPAAFPEKESSADQINAGVASQDEVLKNAEKTTGLAQKQVESAIPDPETTSFPFPSERTSSFGKVPATSGTTWIEQGEGLSREGPGRKGLAEESLAKTGGRKSEGPALPGFFPGESKGYGDLSAYLGAARVKIERAKRYPLEALRKNLEGKVVLSFQINREGEVSGIKLVQSSGYRVLDEEGMATLRRASPFPSLRQIGKENLLIEIPILFRLEKERK